jgi:multiple sugar transport system permease protein
MRTKLTGLVVGVSTLVVLLFFSFPLIWIVFSSFKTNADIFAYPPKVLFTPVTEAYASVFTPEWLDFFKNSTIAAVGATCVALVLGIPAAYALARRLVARADSTMLSILLVRMTPAAVVVIPLFLMFNLVGLVNNLLSLILVYATFDIPYVVWIMEGFIEQVPLEVEEAARLDGASLARIITRIVLPLTRSGLTVAAVLCFVQSWNDLLLALVLSGPQTETVPLRLSSLITTHFALWNELFAAGVINMIPAVVLYFVVRNSLVRGLTLGMIKE